MPLLRVLGKIALGLLFGAVAGVILGFGAYVVFGLANWSSKAGSSSFDVVFILCLVGGALYSLATAMKHEEDIETKKANELAAVEASRKRAEEERLRSDAAERERKASELRQTKGELTRLQNEGLQEFLHLPELIHSAQSQLSQAKEDFRERAFAPFWDAVEGATNDLARFTETVSGVNAAAANYKRRAAQVPDPVPDFALPLGVLPDHRPVASLLAHIVRTAQKDFQFATIYEQRKTNAILVAGFGTLASAIYSVGESISSGLYQLSSNLGESLDDLLVETQKSTNRLDEAASQAASDTAALRQRIEKASDDATKDRKLGTREQEKQTELLKKIERQVRLRKPGDASQETHPK